MENGYLPSLQEIRDAHTWKRDYERFLPVSRFIFRPLGFLVTWFFLRLRFSSEAVSWLSGLFGLIAFLFLLSGNSTLIPYGILMLLLFNLLDCVDGSIARVMKTENPYGKFLDSLMSWIDIAFWAVIGIVAFQHKQLLFSSSFIKYGPLFWPIVGGLTSYFFVLVGYVEGIFDHSVRNEWEKMKRSLHNSLSKTEEISEKELSGQKKFRSALLTIIRKLNVNMRVRENHYFLLLGAYWVNMIDLFLLFFLFYYGLHTVMLIIIYSIRGKRLYNFQSKH